MLRHDLRPCARGNHARASTVALVALLMGAAGCTSDIAGVEDAQSPSATSPTVQEPASIARTCQAEFRTTFKDNFGDPQFKEAPVVRRQAEKATVTGSVIFEQVDASAEPVTYSYTCTMVPNPSVAPSGWAIPTVQLTNKETGVIRTIHQDYPAPSPSSS